MRKKKSISFSFLVFVLLVLDLRHVCTMRVRISPFRFLLLNLFINGLFWRFGFSDKEILVQKSLGQTLNFFCKLAPRSTEPITSSICGLNLVNNLFFLNTGHSIFIKSDVSCWWIIKLGSTLSDNFETMNFWLIVIDFWRKNYSLWIVF